MIIKSNFKYILGIQCFASIDSGACIIKVDCKKKDYEYVAISEERLIRKKYPYTFPLHSIKYCMEYFKIKKLEQLDLLVSDIIREPVWHRSGPSYNVKELPFLLKQEDYKNMMQLSNKNNRCNVRICFHNCEIDNSINYFFKFNLKAHSYVKMMLV